MPKIDLKVFGLTSPEDGSLQEANVCWDASDNYYGWTLEVFVSNQHMDRGSVLDRILGFWRFYRWEQWEGQSEYDRNFGWFNYPLDENKLKSFFMRLIETHKIDLKEGSDDEDA